MHEHCIKCFKNYCDKDSSFVGFGDDSCSSVNCPNQCGIRIHQCKLTEHAEEICSRAVVKCPNHNAGCKQEIMRCRITHHLKKCPAYVIACSALWERSVSLAKTCRREVADSELDYLAAMRDEKVLNDSEQLPLRLLLANRPDGPYSVPDYLREYSANPEGLSFPLYGRTKDRVRSYEPIDEQNKIGIFDFIDESYKVNKLVEAAPKKKPIPERMFPVCCSLCKTRVAKLAQLETASNQRERDESGQAASIVKALNDLKADNSQPSGAVGDIPSTPLCQDCEKSHRKIRLLDYDMKDSKKTDHKVIMLCNQNFRREEIAKHYEFAHAALQTQLSERVVQRCPLTHAGCQFHTTRLVPFDGSTIRYDRSLENYVIKPSICYAEINEGDGDWLESLPPELLFHILDFLDSAALWNLSLTSKLMRGICEQVLHQKGMVVRTWERFQEPTLNNESCIRWRQLGWAWSFSTHTTPCTDWTFTNSRAEISKHLETCPHNNKPRYKKGSRVDYHIFPSQIERMQADGSSIKDINDVDGNMLHKSFDSQYWDPSRNLDFS